MLVFVVGTYFLPSRSDRDAPLIELVPPFRIACAADAPQLAELVNFAGEGLPYYFWTKLAKAGQDPWDIGRARQEMKTQEGQMVVVDFGTGAVAGLTGYGIPASPDPISADFPPLFRPLQELENMVPESWYINVVACYPEQRGMGLGSQLLQLAEDIAQSQSFRRMSVVVADDNVGAQRLYERHGYSELARLPCVREDWQTPTQAWVLLTKLL